MNTEVAIFMSSLPAHQHSRMSIPNSKQSRVPSIEYMQILRSKNPDLLLDHQMQGHESLLIYLSYLYESHRLPDLS